MSERRHPPRLAALVAVAAVAACTAPRYAPYPFEVQQPLDERAFACCRRVLLRDYGALAVADAAEFRLQTTWTPAEDVAGERRATIYRELGPAGGPDELAIVVEVRRVAVPVLGAPGWTEPRGDELAERALARQLAGALAAAGS